MLSKLPSIWEGVKKVIRNLSSHRQAPTDTRNQVTNEDGDEEEEGETVAKGRSFQMLANLFKRNIWLRGPPGTDEKWFGTIIDTGAVKNVMSATTANQLRDAWGIELQSSTKVHTFTLASGEKVSTQTFITLHWMPYSENLEGNLPWPRSDFYVLASNTSMPYDVLIGLEGMHEMFCASNGRGVERFLQGLKSIYQ